MWDMMTAYTSYWEDRFVIYPEVEDEGLFKRLGPLSVLTEHRTIMIAPDPGGTLGGEVNRERNGGLGWRHSFGLGSTRPWARWMMHPTEVAMDDDNTMTIDLPDDHYLAWPKLRTSGIVDAGAVAVREFGLRARSAYLETGEAGIRQVIENMPQAFRSCIANETWTRVIAIAKTGG